MKQDRPYSRLRQPLRGLAVLLLVVGASAAGLGRVAESPEQTEESSAAGKVLSFDASRGRVFLHPSVNGTGPHRFLIDTGYGMNMVQPELAEELDLPRAGRVDIIGIAGRETATMYRDAEFAFDDYIYRPRRVAALPSHRGRPRGILGSGFFRQFVVAIDFSAEEVTLFRPEAFHYAGTGEIIPLRFEDQIPVVETWIEIPDREPIKAVFEIDTGCDGGLCIGRRFIESNEWLRGEEGRRGTRRGVGGSARTEQGEIAWLRMGTNRVRNVGANFFLESDLVEEGYAGHLGCEVLREFKVIFDYTRERLILEAKNAIPAGQ